MELFRTVFDTAKSFYNDINPATLTGAIDVIVVEQENGDLQASPFHVRFGKMGVLRASEKVVDIKINDEDVSIQMKLGDSGEAFFVEQLPDDLPQVEVPSFLATSPLPNAQSLMEAGLIEMGSTSTKPELIRSVSLPYEDATPIAPSATVEGPKTPASAPIDYTMARKDSLYEDTLSVAPAQAPTIPPVPAHDEAIFSLEISDDESERRRQSVEEKPPTSEHQQEGTNGPANVQTDQSIIAAAPVEGDVTPTSRPSSPLSVSDGAASADWKWGELPRTPAATPKAEGVEAPLPSMKVVDETTVTGPAAPASGGWMATVLQPFMRKPGAASKSGELSKNGEVYLDDVTKDPKLAAIYFPKVNFPSSPSADTIPAPPLETTVEDKSSQQLPLAQPISVAHEASAEAPAQQQHEYEASIGGSEQDASSFLAGGGHVLSSSASIDSSTPPASPRSDGPPDAGYASTSKPSSVVGAGEQLSGGLGGGVTPWFFEDGRLSELIGDMAISTCGYRIAGAINDEEFLSHIVNFDVLNANPTILFSPDLVVRIQGKYYNWKVAGPIVISLLVFHQPLSETTIARLMHEQQQHDGIGATVDGGGAPTSATSAYSYWFPWRRAGSAEPSKKPDGIERPQRPLSPLVLSTSPSTTASTSALDLAVPMPSASSTPIVTDAPHDAFNAVVEPPSPRREEKSPSPSPRARVDSTYLSESDEEGGDEKEKRKHRRYRKTLKLVSDDLKQLNLRPGVNMARFSVTTKYQGTTWCTCHIYRWRWDDQLVISDIDGTITKSDVLGHILPVMGGQWAQAGVAQLFSRIVENGYRVVYLSARAIGQSAYTKDYLRWVKQEKESLPDGPLLLSPTSLISAFHREVIEKKPEEFKKSALNDVRALFPTDANPFYAGYGNRINDVWAYRAVGVPKTRIFTINSKGEVRHELTAGCHFLSSYSLLASDLVDHLFPPLARSPTSRTPRGTRRPNALLGDERPSSAASSTSTTPTAETPTPATSPDVVRKPYASFTAAEEFSSFTHWRTPAEAGGGELDVERFKPAAPPAGKKSVTSPPQSPASSLPGSPKSAKGAASK